MIYQLNNVELEQISQIYEIDISDLAEKLNFEDGILSFQPFQKGIKIILESGQDLILHFKNSSLNF